jgi:hypothetical protein
LFAEAPEGGCSLLTQALFFGGGKRERIAFLRGAGSRWLELDVDEIEVFFEAVELKEVGEFECTDVATTGTDLFLEVAHDTLEGVGVKSGAQELEPEPLAVVAQGEVLSGELAVEAMEVLDSGDGILVEHEKLKVSHFFQVVRAASQGSRSRASWTWLAWIEVLAASAAASRLRCAR